MNFKDVLDRFKTELSKGGINDPVRWLSAEQMYLTSKTLYISELRETSESKVEDAFNVLSGDVGTMILVAKGREVIYCSLLMDSFGSKNDIELGNGSFYLYTEPYVQRIETVRSKLKWMFLKLFPFGRVFSGLDYAFSIHQKSKK